MAWRVWYPLSTLIQLGNKMFRTRTCLLFVQLPCVFIRLFLESQYFKKILRPFICFALLESLIKSFLLKSIDFVFWRCVTFSNQFRAVFADLKSSLLAFLQPIIGNWEVTTIHCNVHVIDVKLGRFFPRTRIRNGFYCTWSIRYSSKKSKRVYNTTKPSFKKGHLNLVEFTFQVTFLTPFSQNKYKSAALRSPIQKL